MKVGPGRCPGKKPEFQASCLQKVIENSQQSCLSPIRSCGQACSGTRVGVGSPLLFPTKGLHRLLSHLRQQSTGEWVWSMQQPGQRTQERTLGWVCVCLGECVPDYGAGGCQAQDGVQPHWVPSDTAPSQAQAGLLTHLL